MQRLPQLGFDRLVRRISPRRRPARRSLNVLIVDDERPVCSWVERILKAAGYQTFSASTGADALRVASSVAPLDVLVTDLMMPEMSGDELARRLRQEDPTLRVLYLTGYSDTLFQERAVLWEDEAFLDKPCSSNALTDALSQLVSSHIAVAEPPRVEPARETVRSANAIASRP